MAQSSSSATASYHYLRDVTDPFAPKPRLGPDPAFQSKPSSAGGITTRKPSTPESASNRTSPGIAATPRVMRSPPLSTNSVNSRSSSTTASTSTTNKHKSAQDSQQQKSIGSSTSRTRPKRAMSTSSASSSTSPTRKTSSRGTESTKKTEMSEIPGYETGLSVANPFEKRDKLVNSNEVSEELVRQLPLSSIRQTSPNPSSPPTSFSNVSSIPPPPPPPTSTKPHHSSSGIVTAKKSNEAIKRVPSSGNISNKSKKASTDALSSIKKNSTENLSRKKSLSETLGVPELPPSEKITIPGYGTIEVLDPFKSREKIRHSVLPVNDDPEPVDPFAKRDKLKNSLRRPSASAPGAPPGTSPGAASPGTSPRAAVARVATSPMLADNPLLSKSPALKQGQVDSAMAGNLSPNIPSTRIVATIAAATAATPAASPIVAAGNAVKSPIVIPQSTGTPPILSPPLQSPTVDDPFKKRDKLRYSNDVAHSPLQGRTNSIQSKLRYQQMDEEEALVTAAAGSKSPQPRSWNISTDPEVRKIQPSPKFIPKKLNSTTAAAAFALEKQGMPLRKSFEAEDVLKQPLHIPYDEVVIPTVYKKLKEKQVKVDEEVEKRLELTEEFYNKTTRRRSSSVDVNYYSLNGMDPPLRPPRRDLERPILTGAGASPVTSPVVGAKNSLRLGSPPSSAAAVTGAGAGPGMEIPVVTPPRPLKPAPPLPISPVSPSYSQGSRMQVLEMEEELERQSKCCLCTIM